MRRGFVADSVANEDNQDDAGQEAREGLQVARQLREIAEMKQSDEGQVAKMMIRSDVAGEATAVEVDKDGEDGQEDHDETQQLE